ncbi:MAG TPA: hypothetical protein VGR37_14295 [Longimicrobiaceae bacterium]|nr:hypothetical protein [Longimicrobiaceae bacterium]
MRIHDTSAEPERAEPVRGGPEAELTPERIAEIRRRIREGAYDSAAVAGEVARRILRRGDL